MRGVVAEARAVVRQAHVAGFDQHDRRQVAGDEPLHADQHLVEHLVERPRSGDGGGGIAERLGVRPLLALLGLQPHAVLDLAPQRLVDGDELGRAVLHALVELVERPLQLVLGAPAIGDVLEGAEHADDATVEVAERHLVGLQPAVLARRVAQLFDDAELRLAAVHHLLVPVDEPVGAELRTVGPRHVAVGHADQEAGLDPGETGEDLVAAEVPRLQVLPEHGVRHRVHEDLQHLLTRGKRVGTRQIALQQARIHVANLRGASIGRGSGAPKRHGLIVERSRAPVHTCGSPSQSTGRKLRLRLRLTTRWARRSPVSVENR